MSDRKAKPEGKERSARGHEDQPDTGPDVLLDVPALNVEELDLEAEEVRVRVSFAAELGDMVKINVGLETELDAFKLEVKGLQAEAQLKARLDNVREIFSEVLTTLENNPDLAQDLMGDMDDSNDEPQQPNEPPRKALEESRSYRDDEKQTENGDAGDSGGAWATNAAREKARQLGTDLDGLKGTGSGGRILVKDVMEAARR